MASLRGGRGAPAPRKKRMNPTSILRGGRRRTGQGIGADDVARPSEIISDYEALARLIASAPPPWLPEVLQNWAASLRFQDRMRCSWLSRVELRRSLREVEQAADLLGKALLNTDICLFLNAAGDEPIAHRELFDLLLRDLRIRAMCAANGPDLVMPDGKTRRGRGTAVPPGLIEPLGLCALLIAEAWKHFNGEYPGSKSMKAAVVADRLWTLSGNERISWGDEPLNAWRPYFEAVKSPLFDWRRRGVSDRLKWHEAGSPDPSKVPQSERNQKRS